jgi:hypothetical protein
VDDWNKLTDRLLAAKPHLTADEWRLAIALARLTIGEGREQADEDALRRLFEERS